MGPVIVLFLTAAAAELPGEDVGAHALEARQGAPSERRRATFPGVIQVSGACWSLVYEVSTLDHTLRESLVVTRGDGGEVRLAAETTWDGPAWELQTRFASAVARAECVVSDGIASCDGAFAGLGAGSAHATVLVDPLPVDTGLPTRPVCSASERGKPG